MDIYACTVVCVCVKTLVRGTIQKTAGIYLVVDRTGNMVIHRGGGLYTRFTVPRPEAEATVNRV